MAFPTSNLPTASVPWGREVEKQLTTATTTIASNELNNAARDNQLAASLTRVNAAVVKAQEAIDAVGNLDQATSTYKINADNLTAGTITGLNIIGNTIKSANTGTRVEIVGTDIKFYYGTTMVGKLVGTNYSGSDSMAMLYQNSSNGIYLEPQGGTWLGPNGAIGLGTYGPYMRNSTFTRSASIDVTGLSVVGEIGTASRISGGSFYTEGSISGASLSSSGTLTVSGQSNFNGTMYAAGMTATSSTGGIPVWRSTSSNQLYAYTSSRKQKTDIQPLDIDYDKFTSMPVHSFIYNADFEEFGPSAQRAYGYIAEELDELEYDNLVVFKNNEETGEREPYSVSFFSLAAATHYVTNIQAQKIRSLEERLAALEAK